MTASRRLPHLLGRHGLTALRALAARRALWAFDFDGTLARIRRDPSNVRVAALTAARLARLARRYPVAIVSGRRVADLRGRLGFEPAWILGSHGAEDPGDPRAAQRAHDALEPARAALSRHASALRAAAVRVEDKGQSIALHYRIAGDRSAARVCIDRIFAERDDVHAFHGHCVCNLVAPGVRGKADAVRTLMRRAGAEALFYAGDDADDERVFATARRGWVTVRVGAAGQASRAAYRVDGPGQLGAALGQVFPAT